MSPVPRYLFQRGNVWYVRLQPPGAKAIEKSLGTSDVKLAEIAAADDIKRYKEAMYARRLTRLQEMQTEEHDEEFAAYKPGLHTLPSGGHLIVTGDRITEIDAAGAIISQRARYGRGFLLTGGKSVPALFPETQKTVDSRILRAVSVYRAQVNCKILGILWRQQGECSTGFKKSMEALDSCLQICTQERSLHLEDLEA